MSDNPYAPPESAANYGGGGLGTSNGIIAIEGKQIVTRDVVRFPEACIKTGRTDDLVEVNKKLYWAPSWVWILILINLIAVAIAYYITRKPIETVYYINRSVRNSLRIKVTLGVLMFIGGLIGFVVGLAEEIPLLAGACFVAFIAGLIMVAVYGNTLKPVAHKDGIFNFKGFCPEFLEVVHQSIS